MKAIGRNRTISQEDIVFEFVEIFQITSIILIYNIILKSSSTIILKYLQNIFEKLKISLITSNPLYETTKILN